MQICLGLTLDLFDSLTGQQAEAPASKTRRAAPKTPRLPGDRLRSVMQEEAGESPAFLLAAPHATQAVCPPISATPVVFRHPEASREALLHGVLVAYALRRSKRRTIGFSAGPEGLAVSAPNRLALHEVDKAVAGKADWIVKKLHQTRERHEQMESARIQWKGGAQLPYLGETVTVLLHPSPALGGPSACLDKASKELQLALPQEAAPDQIRSAAQGWLLQQAMALFSSRLNHFAPALQVRWRKLGLSNAGTRWGSARADGAIRLNWRLIHLPPALIDYVVVHELSHLRVMDHSPRFWQTVASVMPDYAALRRKLKAQAVPRW